MKLSRDSVVWWFGMIAAVIVGLATLGDSVTDYGIPATWVPYVRLAALIVGIVSGKLATSPLKGAEDAPAVDLKKIGAPLVLVMLLAGGTAGCASATYGRARHVAAVSVASSNIVLGTAQDLTRGWRCGEPTAPPTCIPPETYAATYAPKFVQAFDLHQKLTELVRATPGDPAIGALLGQLTAILDKIAALLPPELRVTFLQQIGGAQ